MKIENEEQYKAAIKEIDSLWNIAKPEKNDIAGTRFEELSKAIDEYEKLLWPMDDK